jgi:hypothetical protein
MTQVNNECNTQTNEERELEILDIAVKKAKQKTGLRTMLNSDMSKIINILERFLRNKKLVCYGGVAINNILPENEQFYDFRWETPDYDFFSPSALNDAKKLADIFHKSGYKNVNAKAGVHVGTYKIFVENFQIADITTMDKKIFNKIRETAIKKKGILYAPVNLLRMMSYTELSRPEGDVERWHKVLTRLSLLNKYYPIQTDKCDEIEFQRDFEGKEDEKRELYYHVRDGLIQEEVVFFGGWACSLYGRYMSSSQKKKLEVELPDFDALSNDPYTTALAVKQHLEDNKFKSVKIKKHARIEEFLPDHYEIIVAGNTVCFIYDNKHCYSYNIIKRNKRRVKIATIDTMLKFYLAFIYCNKKYFDVNRLLCMSKYLLNVQRENKLAQTGLLKRFTIDCYGNEITLQDKYGKKTELHNKLVKDRYNSEYQKYFLNYTPGRKMNKCSIQTRKNKKEVSTKKNTRKNDSWKIF